MRTLAALAFIVASTSAGAETWIGSAHVVDGDTIYVNQSRLRLRSMDAFESGQTCRRDGASYACGEEATRALISLIGQRDVRCEGTQRDRYDRPLVHCWIGGVDLGRAMVQAGWAVADYGNQYVAEERQARDSRVGAWAGEFERPRAWRATRREEKPTR